MYFYFNIPFTSRDAFVEYPSALRGRTWIDFATHRTAPDLTGPGSVLLWAGRLRAVVSYSRQGRPHTHPKFHQHAPGSPRSALHAPGAPRLPHGSR